MEKMSNGIPVEKTETNVPRMTVSVSSGRTRKQTPVINSRRRSCQWDSLKEEKCQLTKGLLKMGLYKPCGETRIRIAEGDVAYNEIAFGSEEVQ